MQDAVPPSGTLRLEKSTTIEEGYTHLFTASFVGILSSTCGTKAGIDRELVYKTYKISVFIVLLMMADEICTGS